MMLVWLLLCTFVCMGQSQVFYPKYGSTFNLWMSRRIHFIEFNPQNSSDVRTLWKWGDPEISADKKRIKTYLSYMMHNLTQRDSGRYILRGKDMGEVDSYILEVEAVTQDFQRHPGERFGFGADLEPRSCNIYFFPENDRQLSPIDIVHQGRLEGGLDKNKCVGFHLTKSCGILNKDLQMACKGRFEVRDQNGDTALKVSLKMNPITSTYVRTSGEPLSISFDLKQGSCNVFLFLEREGEPREVMVEIVRHGWMTPVSDEYGCTGFGHAKPCEIANEALQTSCSGRFEVRDHNGDTAFEVSLSVEPKPFEPSYLAVGAVVLLISLCYYCVRFCLCGKSPAKEAGPETATEPTERYQENDNEPYRRRPHHHSQPSGTPKLLHFSQCSPTRPLIHKHPTVNVPPASPQINRHPPAVNVPPASPQFSAPDAPTVPVDYDPAPQFELKGVTCPSALTSDSIHCGVYTSDKLNFP